MSIPNTPLWKEFFSQLRDLPELWKVKSDDFKDRNKKKRAWETLLAIYKEIERDANLDSLKKRITNIKTCYRRELKKVEQCVRSGAGAEDEYLPNLWYYDLLDFLREQETQVPGVSTVDFEEDEPLVKQEDCEHLPGTITPQSCSKRKKPTNADHMAERNELLKGALEHIANKDSKNKDEADVFAESWAASFRKLSGTQQIYARKAIEDVLVLGQLNLLSLNTVNTQPSKNDFFPISISGSSQSSGSSTPNHYSQPRHPQPYDTAVTIPGNAGGLFTNNNMQYHGNPQAVYTTVHQLLSDSEYS